MNDEKQVFLKPTTLDDFEEYYQIRSDPSDVYWNGYLTAPEKESFREGFKRRTGFSRFALPEDRRNYLIKLTGSDITVGFLQLIRHEDAVELGYSVASEFQGNGYASGALRIGVELARAYQLPLIVLIRDDNIASQRVALKCGFKWNGEMQEKPHPVVGKMKFRVYEYHVDQRLPE